MAKQYGMAIDMGKCVGCGTCAIACKTENNTRHEDLVNGRKYNWLDFINTESGKFPNPKFMSMPVQCNHCADAACVTACPVDPDANGRKAMFKTDTGITMHDDSRCIGCQKCVDACPYSDKNTITAGVQYSVISYNPSGASSHPFWSDVTSVHATGTSTPKAIADLAVAVPPYKHDYTHAFYEAVRKPAITEKCYFCEHRVLVGELPYCVVSCPTQARTFGDVNDSKSDLSKLLKANNYSRLKDNAGVFLGAFENGTKPNVYYLSHPTAPATPVKEEKVNEVKEMRVFPNPVINHATIEFDLIHSTAVVISIYDIKGNIVKKYDEQKFPAGTNEFRIDVIGLSQGLYICSLVAADGVKMTANILVPN